MQALRTNEIPIRFFIASNIERRAMRSEYASLPNVTEPALPPGTMGRWWRYKGGWTSLFGFILRRIGPWYRGSIRF